MTKLTLSDKIYNFFTINKDLKVISYCKNCNSPILFISKALGVSEQELKYCVYCRIAFKKGMDREKQRENELPQHKTCRCQGI